MENINGHIDLRRSYPGVGPRLKETIVWRLSSSPTITIADIGSPNKQHGVTPFQLLWRLGIYPQQYTASNKEGINTDWSVHSFLWAMSYCGLMPILASWPEGSFPAGSPLGKPVFREGYLIGHRWMGGYYRPEYAFAALMSFVGWKDWGVEAFCKWMLSLPSEQRLPTLQKVAAFYLTKGCVDINVNGFNMIFDEYDLTWWVS